MKSYFSICSFVALTTYLYTHTTHSFYRTLPRSTPHSCTCSASKSHLFDYNREEHLKIGDIMRKLTPYLKLYTDYVKDFQKASALVDYWENKSSAFAAMIREIRVRSLCINLLLHSLHSNFNFSFSFLSNVLILCLKKWNSGVALAPISEKLLIKEQSPILETNV